MLTSFLGASTMILEPLVREVVDLSLEIRNNCWKKKVNDLYGAVFLRLDRQKFNNGTLNSSFEEYSRRSKFNC